MNSVVIQLPAQVAHMLPMLMLLAAAAVVPLKYAVQYTKDLVIPQKASKREQYVRIYAGFLGAVGLFGVAQFFGLGLEWHAACVQGLFGLGAGFAAIGDYHLMDLLRGAPVLIAGTAPTAPAPQSATPVVQPASAPAAVAPASAPATAASPATPAL